MILLALLGLVMACIYCGAESYFERDLPRSMFRWVMIFVGLLAATVSVFGQASYYSAVAKTVSKTVAPGQSASILTLPFARINVCAAPASPISGGVCVNQVQVYSDSAMTQPVPQPFSADGQGNFGFYVQPGQYAFTVASTYGTWLGTYPFTVSGLSPSGAIIPIEAFGGVTIDQKLAAAIASTGGINSPSQNIFTVNSPGTWAANVVLPSADSVRIYANITGTVSGASMLRLNGSTSVSCSPGVSISGPTATGSYFLDTPPTLPLFSNGTPTSYPAPLYDFDLLANCSLTGFDRAVYFEGNVRRVKVHDAVFSAANRDGISIGNNSGTAAAQQTTVQPQDIMVYRNHFLSLGNTGFNGFTSHNVEFYGNTCAHLLNYCGVESGGDAGGFQQPIGNVTAVNMHDNNCNDVEACEFVVLANGFQLGRGSIANQAHDTAFDAEGSTNGVISGTCFQAGNYCASTFFYSNNVTFDGVISPDSIIYIKNSSQTPSNAADIAITNSRVQAIGADATLRLVIAGNTVHSITLGFNSGLRLFSNIVNFLGGGTSDAVSINVPFDVVPAVVRQNTVRNLGSASTGSGISIISGFYGGNTYATMEGNDIGPGFAHSLHFITNQNNPASTQAYWAANGNHRSGDILHTVLQGTGTVTENSFYDSSEVFHPTPSGRLGLSTDGTTGTCGSSSLTYVNTQVVNADGTVTTRKVVTCP